MEARRIGRPVALDRAQLAGGIGDRGDGDLARLEPDVLRPGGGARGPTRNQQPLAGEIDRPDLVRQLGNEPFGDEIRGARRFSGRLRVCVYVVRPSRRPRCGLLRMTFFLNPINILRHPEERPKGASRRTHGCSCSLDGASIGLARCQGFAKVPP
jgi:hypothetical protein